MTREPRLYNRLPDCRYSEPSMQCSKCNQQNPEAAIYCTRCHAPLKYTCPSCKHVQLHGGSCDKCGVDFVKYAAMLVFGAKSEAAARRESNKRKSAIWRQIVLLPITGGYSLIKFILGKARGD